MAEGFLGGMLARRQEDRADVTTGLQQMQAQGQQFKALNDNIGQTFDHVTKILEAADTKGIDRNDPRLKSTITPLIQSALKTAAIAEQSGIPGATGLTDAIAARFKGLVFTPTPEEAAATKGRSDVAQITGSAQAAGVEPTTGLQKAGIVPEAQQPQTDIGKTIFDQELVEKQFGKDSPQAKAFKELLSSKQKGETFKLSDVSGLRKEFTQASGDFVKIRDAFGKVEVAAKNPSAAGDLALIFNFMKMLDPGSTVREGEFANAQNAGGIPDRVRNLYNSLKSGERVKFTRDDFLATANNVMRSQLRFQKQLERQYKGIAQRQEMPSDDVVVDFIGEYRDEKRALEQSLTPQERNIVAYHRNTIATGRTGRDAQGRPVTVFSTGIRIPDGPNRGKFVSVPGFVNGQIITDERALYRHWKQDIDAGKWPIYASGEELNRRSQEIHTIMDAESPVAQMSREELLSLRQDEIEKMTPDELKAMDKRMKDVGL